jgi:hypothetical protein
MTLHDHIHPIAASLVMMQALPGTDEVEKALLSAISAVASWATVKLCTWLWNKAFAKKAA